MLDNLYIVNERYNNKFDPHPEEIKKQINQEIGELKKPFKNGHSSTIKKILKNTTKLLKIIALVVQKPFYALKYKLGLGNSLRLPKGQNQLKKLRGRIKHQIDQEVHLVSRDERKMIRSEVREFIQKENLEFPKEQLDEIVDSAVATYATTKKYYGPVVIEWAKSLLDTAVKENRKIAFLARDGRAPYEIARKIKQMYPKKYANVELSYLYFSRKVVEAAKNNTEEPHLLEEYMQLHGFKKNDRCIFVDVGFLGSMIRTIKKQLKGMKLDIQFQYLVSMNRKAKGFLSDLQIHLESIPCDTRRGAGGSDAAHWLEDTHQGVINSPTRLIKDEHGVHPDNFDGSEWKTCKEESPFDYLHKHFGQVAIRNAVTDRNVSETTAKPWKMASDKARRAFDDFCIRIKNEERLIYVNHF